MPSYYDNGADLAEMRARGNAGNAGLLEHMGGFLMPSSGERMQRTQIVADALAAKQKEEVDRRKIGYADAMKSIALARPEVQAAGAQFFGATPDEQARAVRAVPFLNPEKATPTYANLVEAEPRVTGSKIDLTGKNVTAGEAQAAGPAETVLSWLRPPPANNALAVAQWKASHGGGGSDMKKWPTPYDVEIGFGNAAYKALNDVPKEERADMDAGLAGQLAAAQFYARYPDRYSEHPEAAAFAAKLDTLPEKAEKGKQSKASYIRDLMANPNFATAPEDFQALVQRASARVNDPRFWQFWRKVAEYNAPVPSAP